MKRILCFLFVISISVALLSLEPVGFSAFYDLSVSLKDNQKESVEVLEFPESSFIKLHLSQLVLGDEDSITISGGGEEYSIKGPFDGDIWLPSVSSDTVNIILNGNPERKPYYVIDEIGLGNPQLKGSVESICQNDDRQNAVCY
ncbi:MAG: hypothetical protein N2445_03635, partial [Acidobacteria bacterium]|nr:hypothetical protein [Acidobacteriota bacterium]